MQPRRNLLIIAVLSLFLIVAACGNESENETNDQTVEPEDMSGLPITPESTEPDEESGVAETDEANPESTQTEVDPDNTPTEADSTESVDEDTDSDTPNEPAEPVSTLTPEELEEHRPNELGQVFVLMYHQIGDGETAWDRTPEQFRSDLQWLYDNDFYVISAIEYVRNEIRAPAGKRPVVLTFDDGTVSQFRYILHDDGTTSVDPDSAIGILEDFFTRYDDFGRGGLFSILPRAPFAWPDAPDQLDYSQEKMQWMLDNGYEFGNHTLGHINLRENTDEVIMEELAGAEDMIRDYVPDAEVNVLAVPYGMYPEGGDTTLFHGFELNGQNYSLEGALMVGAEPAPSPVHNDFDPMWIPRVNSDDEQLGRWFAYVEENPGMIYVSDGNPDTITIPEETHPWLVGSLDEAKAEGKTIVRY